MKNAVNKPLLTPDFVARALGLAAHPSSPLHFSGVITDTRKITPDCLFVALKGDNFDGHQFVSAAIAQGAKGIICLNGTSIPELEKSGSQVHAYFVDDTVAAFRKLAFAWRKEFSIPVVAVAGSVGKTTTKELLTSILGGKYSNVLKTQGSQNGFVGIPMTLLELRPEHQAAVIEVGIDEIGAMKQHMEIVCATAAVLTTIGPEHLEKLIDLPTVAREEGFALEKVASENGWVAISLDDPWIAPLAQTLSKNLPNSTSKQVTFSLVTKELKSNPAAQLTGHYNPHSNALEVRNTQSNLKSIYLLPLQGIHNARNALAAIGVATSLGLTSADIQKGLRGFKTADGRSEVREIAKGGVKYKVVCDYYNANPTSTEAGLALLSQIAGPTTQGPIRFACLADMLELGTYEEKFHRDLAPIVIQNGVEHVFLYGPRMKNLEDELKKRGFKKELRHFETQEKLAETLTSELKPGSTVLIKGSRGMKMEKVWELLQRWSQS